MRLYRKHHDDVWTFLCNREDCRSNTCVTPVVLLREIPLVAQERLTVKAKTEGAVIPGLERTAAAQGRRSGPRVPRVGGPCGLEGIRGCGARGGGCGPSPQGRRAQGEGVWVLNQPAIWKRGAVSVPWRQTEPETVLGGRGSPPGPTCSGVPARGGGRDAPGSQHTGRRLGLHSPPRPCKAVCLGARLGQVPARPGLQAEWPVWAPGQGSMRETGGAQSRTTEPLSHHHDPRRSRRHPRAALPQPGSFGRECVSREGCLSDRCLTSVSGLFVFTVK